MVAAGVFTVQFQLGVYIGDPVLAEAGICLIIPDGFGGPFGWGDSTVTYYPFTAQILDESAQLPNNSWVQVTVIGSGEGISEEEMMAGEEGMPEEGMMAGEEGISEEEMMPGEEGMAEEGAMPGEEGMTEEEMMAGEGEEFYTEESGSEQEFYLWKAFIREEDNKKYVLKEGENGTLVKQEIKVGKLNGEGYLIISGVSRSDWLAFPYGKGVKEGAKTRHGTMDELYGM